MKPFLMVLLVLLFSYSFFILPINASKAEVADKEMQNYFFKMPETEVVRLGRIINSFQLGEKKVVILRKIDRTPDYDQVAVDKKGNFICKELIFYVQRWRAGLVNEKHDKSVELEFDLNDNLIRINSNIDFIQSRP